MTHKSSIYANIVIIPGFFYVKLLDVHVEEGDRPYLWASLMTAPSHRDAGATRFASIIYRTAKTEEMTARFRQTFRIQDDSLDACLDALGRWGCVCIEPTVYEGHEYSAVRYITQNNAMRRLALSAEKWEDNMGFVEWPAGVDPRPARHGRDEDEASECLPEAREPITNGWNCL